MFKAVFVDLLNHFNDQHGIYSLSSVLKKNNIDARFVCMKNTRRALKKLAQIKPDLLLYSSFSMTMLDFIKFDKLAKEALGVKSVIGGPGTRGAWQLVESSTIDAICIGEGEDALVEFINNGFKSNKNIFLRGENFPSEFYPLVDVNKLPFPDRSVIYDTDSLLRNAPSKQFFSGRGCPYHCTYCFNHKHNQLFKGYGPVIRQKNVDYLLEEIKDVKRKYPLSNIVFNDDLFILNKKWFLEFCRRFPREIGLPYTCNVRANLLDEDRVKALKDSNCRTVNWSIEAGNEFLRNQVLKRGMSSKHILDAARLLNKYKILFRVGNMLGIPGETFEQMEETVDLNIKAKPTFALANIFLPFPGLELTEYAIRKGYYTEHSLNDLPKNYFTKAMMNTSKKEKIQTYKMFCLFPFFVRLPFLFYNRFLKRMLFLFPGFILRLIYEFVYTTTLARFYTPRTPLSYKCQMAIRYLRNL